MSAGSVSASWKGNAIKSAKKKRSRKLSKSRDFNADRLELDKCAVLAEFSRISRDFHAAMQLPIKCQIMPAALGGRGLAQCKCNKRLFSFAEELSR